MGMGSIPGGPRDIFMLPFCRVSQNSHHMAWKHPQTPQIGSTSDRTSIKLSLRLLFCKNKERARKLILGPRIGAKSLRTKKFMFTCPFC